MHVLMTTEDISNFTSSFPYCNLSLMTMIVFVGTDKSPLTPSISPEFYNQTRREGPSNMVSEPGGLEFELRPRIFRCA
jgi:hypothetical protein